MRPSPAIVQNVLAVANRLVAESRWNEVTDARLCGHRTTGRHVEAHRFTHGTYPQETEYQPPSPVRAGGTLCLSKRRAASPCYRISGACLSSSVGLKRMPSSCPWAIRLAITGSAVRCLPIPLNLPSKSLHQLVRSRGPRGLPTPNVAAGHGSRCGVPSHAVLTGCQNTLPTAKTRCGRVEQQLVGCSVACRALHKRTAGGSPKLQVEAPRRTNFWVGGGRCQHTGAYLFCVRFCIVVRTGYVSRASPRTASFSLGVSASVHHRTGAHYRRRVGRILP